MDAKVKGDNTEGSPGGVTEGVDVVVVSYNSRSALRRCIEPLSESSQINPIVVDNASTDGSLDSLTGLNVETCALRKNIGFGGGCNVGLRLGTAPYVMFLNPDAVIAPTDVRVMIETLEESGVDAVVPRIIDDSGGLDWSLRRFPEVRSILGQALFLHRLFPRASWTDEVIREPRRYETEGHCAWASGACLLVRRDVLERLGGFDEGFFMYCEDVDLCRRIWTLGKGIVYTPAATCIHTGGASAPRASLIPLLTGSRIRYARKHFGTVRSGAYQAGVVLSAITHMVIARTVQARVGHAQALRAAVTGPRAPSRPASGSQAGPD